MSKNATEKLTIQSGQSLQGTTRVPGDKSLSHRAILMGMLANGTTQVRGWLAAGDTEATLGTARALGVIKNALARGRVAGAVEQAHPDVEFLRRRALDWRRCGVIFIGTDKTFVSFTRRSPRPEPAASFRDAAPSP